MSDQPTGELYALVKDLTFSDILRMQDSPTDIYLTRLEQMGITQDDWEHFIDILNELTRSEVSEPQPGKDETVDAYITRMAEQKAQAEASSQSS